MEYEQKLCVFFQGEISKLRFICPVRSVFGVCDSDGRASSPAVVYIRLYLFSDLAFLISYSHFKSGAIHRSNEP